MIESPLSKGRDIVIESKIKVKDIVYLYSSTFRINVSEYFGNINELLLCRDNQTDYRFFYPPVHIDSRFYEKFQDFDWYYMDTKWEFTKALSVIPSDAEVLEVGCGKGAFLKILKEKNIKSVGLELNKESVNELNSSGFEVYDETIQNFACKNGKKFDVVLSFQVLEHVYDVHSFLESLLSVLKKGGILIISVPNNESFLKHTHPFVLNIPPHHVGWWNLKSLKSLGSIYGVKFVDSFYEPLQPYHYDWYYNILKSRIIKRYGKWTKLFFYPFRNKRYRFILSKLDKYITGHTIMTVYKKSI